jgi:hypothetical protein
MGMFFFLVHFSFLLRIISTHPNATTTISTRPPLPTQANEDPRRPTTTTKDQCRPARTTAGQWRSTLAMQANNGQHRLAQANRGQGRCTFHCHGMFVAYIDFITYYRQYINFIVCWFRKYCQNVHCGKNCYTPLHILWSKVSKYIALSYISWVTHYYYPWTRHYGCRLSEGQKIVTPLRKPVRVMWPVLITRYTAINCYLSVIILWRVHEQSNIWHALL